MGLWTLLRDSRAPYFAAMALPILLGSVVAWGRCAHFDVGLFALSLLAGTFLQAGTHMTNDFFDYAPDEAGGPKTLDPPQQVLQGALAFFVVGAMVGVYITLATGPLVLLFGVIGIASGYLYSAPPFRLSGSGIGELVAGLNLGLLTTLGAYYIHCLTVPWSMLWVALPVALLMSATLILNGFQPAKLATRASLWARLGARRAGVAYALPALLAYALLIIGVALEELPILAALGLLGLPLVAVAVASAHLQRLNLALASAVAAHLGTTACLILAFFLNGLLQ